MDVPSGWTQVIHWYQTYLGRDPSKAEGDYWVGLMVFSGIQPMTVEQFIRTSQEAVTYSTTKNVTPLTADREYVAGLYTTTLGRQPDPDGLIYWTNLISSGAMTREQVAQAFDRFEPASYVSNLYTTHLGRVGNPDEIAYWADLIASGQLSREQAEEFIRTSVEAFTKPAPAPPAVDATPDGFAELKSALELYGLGSLSEWALAQIRQGRSVDEVMMLLRERPEFKAAFPEIDLRRDADKTPLSVSEILSYREGAAQLMRQAGLPPGFWDGIEDFTNLIVGDVSLVELQERVAEGFRFVNSAPQEVKEAFAQMYGPSGEAALAAWFLDAERAAPILEEQVQASIAKGTAATFDFAIDQAMAERLAGIDVTSGQARQGFGELDRMRALFSETIAEEDRDLTAETEGVEAVFGLGAGGSRALDERLRSRKAAVSGGGGAIITERGIGLGEASGG